MYEATARGAHGFARRVAIKRLLPEASGNPELTRMFLDEALTASRLHHAGIVSVLDYAVVDDAPFQVLELVDGWDASFLLRAAKARGQTMPPDIALYLATEVAHALAYAHEARDERGVPLGIVHRDVKPSNMLVSRGGDVKLGDFGIALARERASKTTGFVARGTPAYMSPEQLLGSGMVDVRTDIFALGCTLHALVTGTSPLSDETARAAMMSGGNLRLDPTLAPGIGRIVERAVSIAAPARFASAREMAVAMGGELAALLRTDPKTRMLEWLSTLTLPVRPPSTATLGVVSSAPKTTMGVSATLAQTDRFFLATMTTVPGSEASVPFAPVRAVSRAPLVPQNTAHYVSPTIDATLAMAPRFSPPRSEAPHPSSRRRLVFGIAFLVPILIAAIGGAGIVIGHKLTVDQPGEAGAARAPGSALDAAPPVDAQAPAPSESPKAARPSAGQPRSSAAVPPASSTPASTVQAGLGPPVPGGCRCDAVLPDRVATAGLCHPGAATASPSCKCQVGAFEACWKPFAANADTCPERFRTMDPSATNGQACTAFLIHGRDRPADAGADFKDVVADVASPGRLASCNRCSENRLYPRTNGASCVGIASSTGQRFEGRVVCF